MSNRIDGVFVSAAGCIDGRTWQPIQEFAKQELGADHVDIAAAEPGFVKSASKRLPRRLLRRLEISATHHGVTDLIVFGHESCAGNPVDNELHEQQTLRAARRLQAVLPEMKVYAVFVEKRELSDGPKWTARRLFDTNPAQREDFPEPTRRSHMQLPSS